MPLDRSKITELLNKSQSSGRGGSRKLKNPGKTAAGKTIDTTIRDYQTWFKLAHHLFDQETGEPAKCENPDCLDTRNNSKTITVEVSGVMMCRICFLAGWKLNSPDQLTIQPPSPTGDN